jgi:tetratricopeptide (TPR) repeat protein
VEGVEGFALAPDLDGEAIAALSTPEELRAGHARAAAGLLRLFGLAGESRFFQIARHFQRAGDLDRAAEHYVGAARYAARMYANRKGIEAYSLALDTCCRAERRRDIASELGDLYVRVGEYSGALRCFRLARELHAQVSREAAGAPNGDAHGPTNGGTAAEAATELEVGFLERLGRILQRQGKLEEALAHFALCLERGGSFPSLRARALFRLGSLHLERGDLGAARAQLEESLTLYERLSDFEQIAEVHSHLGIVEKHEDRLEAASRRFEKAMESAERSGNLSKLATTLNNLGNLHRAIGDDGRAIECLARSVALRERIGDRLGLGICLNNTAQIHSHRGEYAAAWKSTEAALKIFEEIGDPKGIVIARANLGEMKRVAGEFQQARELLVEILRLANRWRMQRFHGLILCSFGLLETDYGNYAAALERFHECLRAVPTDKPSETRALALTGFAAASIRRGDFERAEDAIEEALAIAREIKLREKLGSLVSAQTRLHLERGDPERALDIARQALSRGEAGMERFGAALLHREMGRVYRELGPDWADHTEKHLGRALAEFERMGSPHNAAEAHAELALYWRLLGEEEQAARFFSAAEDGFRLTGARPRLEEVLATRGRS